MCRYADHHYKQHFACFECRKAFKRHENVVGWVRSEARPGKWMAKVTSCGPALCPGCRRPMVAMGLDFKAPPKSDRKQWIKVEILSGHDIRFSSCGCAGPGPRPRTLADVGRFLAERPTSSPGERYLRSLDRRRSRPESTIRSN